MKSLKLAIAGLCMIAAGAFAVTACGPSNTCSSDSDCAGSDVCYTGTPQSTTTKNTCVPGCGEEAGLKGACKNTEQCVELASGKEGCIAKSGGADTGTPDAGDTGTDTDGGTQEASYFVQVKDVTKDKNTQDRDNDGTDDGQQMCDAAKDSEGADVFGVELLDANGQSMAWGSVVVDNAKGSGNNDVDAVFGGTMPSLVDSPDPDDGQQCPGSGGSTEFSSSTVVSLGCGGNVVVGFKDGDGNYIPIKSGYEVAVYEYAVSCFKHDANGNLQCKPEDDPVGCAIEYTELFVCDPASSAMAQAGDLQAASVDGEGNFPQCTQSIGSGKGVTYTVSVP